MLALQASYVAQLQVAGLPQWAAYVACSGAAHCPTPAGDSIVRQLLEAAGPCWASRPELRDFLEQRLRLPPAWVAAARALWARQQLKPLGEPLHTAAGACLLLAAPFAAALEH